MSQANTSGRSRTGLLLFLLSTSYIAITLNIQGFVGMLPFVQREFSLSGAQAGLYTSFYFMSATAVAIFAGRIVDRVGTRAGLVLGVGIVGGMMLLHSISPLYGIILVLAFVTGIGFSLITPSVSKGVIDHVSGQRRAGAMGLVHGVGGTGALVGTALLPFLAQMYGWRVVLAASGGAALLIALITLRVYRSVAEGAGPAGGMNRGADATQRADATLRARGTGSAEAEGIAQAAGDSASAEGGSAVGEGKTSTSILHDIRGVLSDRRFRSVCFLGITFGIALSSVTGHMTLFLTQDLGYTPAVGGLGLAMFHVGGVLGQPGWGIINDRFFGGHRRRGLILLVLLSSAMSLLFGAITSAGAFPLVGLLASSALMGFIVLGMPGLYFTTVSEMVPTSLTGLATGVALVFSRTGVVIAAPIFGHLSDVTGSYRVSWLVLAVVLFAIASYVSFGVLRSRGDLSAETAEVE